jgi:hypothetical protein
MILRGEVENLLAEVFGLIAHRDELRIQESAALVKRCPGGFGKGWAVIELAEALRP